MRGFSTRWPHQSGDVQESAIMTIFKPELDWLDSPEIYRQEILDLIPRESSNRDAFTDTLISHISRSHIQPDIISVLKTRQKGNSLLRKARRKLKTMKKINIETGQEIRKWIEDTTDPEKVSRSFSVIPRNGP